MDLGLKDKVAFVSASSRGLGAATAWQLAREGARVVVNARQPERLEATAAAIRRETGAPVLALPGDVTAPGEAERLIGETVRQLGGLDILITNAGGPPPGRFDELDDAAWLAAVDQMLLSAVRLIRAGLPHLRQSSAAAVLTITSYSVKQPLPNLVLSNSVRLAVVGLTKSLALELGEAGIRFNSILPGYTDTERVQALLADRARRAGTRVEEEARKQAAASPLGRIATPQEFANAAVFLCSPAAAYLTGVMLPVDGGTLKGTL